MLEELYSFACIFEKFAKEKPVYMFHGTTKDRLPSILSQGLITNPKQKNWDNINDGDYYNPSRESVGGIYLTHNLMSAYGAASNGKNRDVSRKFSKIIIMVQVKSNSLVADEDSISISLPTNEQDLCYNYFELILTGQCNDLRDNILTRLVAQLKYTFKYVHEKLIERLKKLISDHMSVILGRRVSYISDYTYEKVWHYFKNNREMPAKPLKKDVEMEYKEFEDKITRTLKMYSDVYKYTGQPFNLSGRSLEPIRYVGSNKIIAIFEDVKLVEYETSFKLLYPKSINDIPKDALDSVVSQGKASFSSEFKIIS